MVADLAQRAANDLEQRGAHVWLAREMHTLGSRDVLLTHFEARLAELLAGLSFRPLFTYPGQRSDHMTACKKEAEGGSGVQDFAHPVGQPCQFAGLPLPERL